jgi:flagellar biosynthesis/type III secretory pathway M-ring protein FliF/YscJ
MNWLKTIGAFFIALVGLFFAYRHVKHRRKQNQSEQKAAELETRKVQEVAEAEKARKEAREHRNKANAALDNAQKRVDKLKENGHESLANRVDAVNQRLRDD